MGHDFVNSPGNARTCDTTGQTCTGIGSVMDYYQVSTELMVNLKNPKTRFEFFVLGCD